jgi:hypothetical protein
MLTKPTPQMHTSKMSSTPIDVTPSITKVPYFSALLSQFLLAKDVRSEKKSVLGETTKVSGIDHRLQSIKASNCHEPLLEDLAWTLVENRIFQYCQFCIRSSVMAKSCQLRNQLKNCQVVKELQHCLPGRNYQPCVCKLADHSSIVFDALGSNRLL